MQVSADIVRFHARPRLAAGARFDVAIAGGGAVGAALACALADSGASVLLADPRFDAAEPSPAFAPRPIALSLATERVLASLGVWDGLAPAATPIESIHVSEAGRFGAARLAAAECGVARFGSVVAAGALGAALRDAVARRDAIRRTGGRIVDADPSGGKVVSRVVDEAAGTSLSIGASLIVVADGGRSELRDSLGIDSSVRRLPAVGDRGSGGGACASRAHCLRAVHARGSGGAAADGREALRTRVELRRGACE